LEIVESRDRGIAIHVVDREPAGFDTLVVPRPNAREAALVADIKISAIATFHDASRSRSAR